MSYYEVLNGMVEHRQRELHRAAALDRLVRERRRARRDEAAKRRYARP